VVKAPFVATLIAASLAAATPAQSQVSVSVNIGSPPPVIVAQPVLVPVQASPVYYAPSYGTDVFFYDGRYYTVRDDHWFYAARVNTPWMAIADTVKQDLAAAMKAGERDRVGALRLVLSELQKAAKEGGDDEVAVLRRERKRRLDAAEQFRSGGRPELAENEEAEAELISAYLPAELSDEELRAIVERAVGEVGATSPKDMGAVMKAAMPAVGGRADGRRVSAQVREVLSG